MVPRVNKMETSTFAYVPSFIPESIVKHVSKQFTFYL